MASGVADAAAGGAGVPAQVGPPPGVGVAPDSGVSAPVAPGDSAPSSDGGAGSAPSSDGLSASGTQQSFNFGRQQRRNLIPDDGSEHTPPPQLRMEGED